MYLRRLRTVMDELLQPPGTPPKSLIIEKRVRELMDLLDPPGFKPSDAALDDAAWPNWGSRTSMRSEAQRIIDEYLPGRRNFLFKSSRAKLRGEAIPAAQPSDVTLQFRDIESRSPATEQFVCITNQNNFAVDVSGWRLAGAGIEHHFRPGTVIPAGNAIYMWPTLMVFGAGPPVRAAVSPCSRREIGRAACSSRGDRTAHRCQRPNRWQSGSAINPKTAIEQPRREGAKLKHRAL